MSRFFKASITFPFLERDDRSLIQCTTFRLEFKTRLRSQISSAMKVPTNHFGNGMSIANLWDNLMGLRGVCLGPESHGHNAPIN